MVEKIQIYWDDTLDNLLIGEISGTADWGDYHKLHDQVFDIIRACERERVDFIFLVLAGTPPGSPFSHIKRTSKRWREHDRAKEYLMVVPNQHTAALANALINIAKRIARTPTRKTDYRVLSSLEAARELIVERRQAAKPQPNIPSE